MTADRAPFRFSLPSGIDTAVGANESALTLNGGVLDLGAGNFTRSLGTTAGLLQFTAGGGGFAAYSADRLVNLGGATATVTWASGNFVPTASPLILGAADATHMVTFQTPIDFKAATRTVQVADGAAPVDAILSGALTNGGLTKTGTGAQTLSGANTYAGVTTLSAGTLSVATIGNGGVASGNLGSASSAAASLVFDGGKLQYTGATAGTDRSFTINGGKTATFDIATAATNLTVSGASTATNGALTKTGAGKLILTGANLHTGTTTVSQGTLEAAAAGALGATSNVTVNTGGTLLLSGATTDRINNAATVTLAGGTIAFTGNVTEGSSPGTGALTLTANSIIDFGGGNDVFNFGASNLATWTGGAVLSIYNWGGSYAGGGNDQLKFGLDNTALTSGQLGQISFYSDNGTMAGFLGTGTFVGSLGEVVPVPEPSSVFLGLAMCGLAGWRERRREEQARRATR